MESRLCARDKEGRPILDSIGDPVLECMCGNVICGRFDPSKPFFTAKGSFWSNSTTELKRYREVGELRYIAEKKRQAVGFIRARPAFFLNLCVRRGMLFWCGIPEIWSEDITPRDVLPQWPQVALASLAFAGLAELARRHGSAAWFFAPVLAVYPALYYVTFPDARYRFPIEPVMVMLAVYAVSQSWNARSRASQK